MKQFLNGTFTIEATSTNVSICFLFLFLFFSGLCGEIYSPTSSGPNFKLRKNSFWLKSEMDVML